MHRLRTLAILAIAPVCYGQGYTISTVAGPGQSGAFGDGGPATSAYLTAPAAVAMDAAGDLFIAFSKFNGSLTGTLSLTGPSTPYLTDPMINAEAHTAPRRVSGQPEK
jgi:hypothetical protein